MKKWCITLIILFLLPLSASATDTPATETKTISFVVNCYDRGAYALVRLPGIKRIMKLWKGDDEVNTVIYDPTLVSPQEMEKKLIEKKAYISTLPVPVLRSDE